MSSLSNLPYGEILDYWYEKLSGKRFRRRFLLTKVVEIHSFKKHSARNITRHEYQVFPSPVKNKVSANPKVALVIPVYVRDQGDLAHLKNLLQSVDRLSKKPEVVIVVDDGSPVRFDCSNEIVLVRLDKNSGSARARNTGKKLALEKDAEIIAFTDIDCILDEQWSEAIVNGFHSHPEFQILSGNTLSFDSHWYGTYHEINGTLNGRKLKETEQLLYGTTANMAITSEVARAVDFNERFPIAAGEDIEFCFRANQNGFAIGHISQMVLRHNYGYERRGLRSLKKFRSLFKKYGQGERILLKEVPEYYAYFDRSSEIPARQF